MRKVMKITFLLTVVVGLLAIADSEQASAQSPVVVTTYSPVQPVVAYYPQRRGLFGRRIVYRPVVTYAVPATPVPATTYYAPAAPVTTYYAPAPRIAPAPVTTYYAPAPVTTYYYAPVIGF
jgi:hypothetical protein